MALLNAGILNRLANPRTQESFRNERSLARINALKAQELETNQANAAADRDAALRAAERRQAIASGFDASNPTATGNALIQGGDIKGGRAFLESFADIGKTRADTAGVQATTTGKRLENEVKGIELNARLTQGVPRTREGARQLVRLQQRIHERFGVGDPDELQNDFSLVEQLPDEQLGRWFDLQLKEGRAAEKSIKAGEDVEAARVAQAGAVDLENIRQRGQTQRTAATNASNERRAAIAAAKANAGKKKLPTAALKMQNEELTLISTVDKLNADLAEVARQIKDGEIDLGPLANLRSKSLNLAGMSSEQSRNFASLQARIEGLRNASLRLNKGIQTEGDAQRAMKELVENLNDPDLVLQRLQEIQETNLDAMRQRKENVALIRENFGLEPLPLDNSSGRGASGAFGEPDGERVVNFSDLP